MTSTDVKKKIIKIISIFLDFPYEYILVQDRRGNSESYQRMDGDLPDDLYLLPGRSFSGWRRATGATPPKPARAETRIMKICSGHS